MHGLYVCTQRKAFLSSYIYYRKGSTLARLEGHASPILSCRFDSQNPHICASVSEDGALKVWDLRARTCIYDCSSSSHHPSSSSSSDSLVSLAFHPTVSPIRNTSYLNGLWSKICSPIIINTTEWYAGHGIIIRSNQSLSSPSNNIIILS